MLVPVAYSGPARLSCYKAFKMAQLWTFRFTVIRARHLKQRTHKSPDTYIKVYMLECSSKGQKKKSRLHKSSCSPSYNQVFCFDKAATLHRTLAMCVLARERFARNIPLGEAQINLSSLDLTVRLTAWYRLFLSHPQIPPGTWPHGYVSLDWVWFLCLIIIGSYIFMF